MELPALDVTILHPIDVHSQNLGVQTNILYIYKVLTQDFVGPMLGHFCCTHVTSQFILQPF